MSFQQYEPSDEKHLEAQRFYFFFFLINSKRHISTFVKFSRVEFFFIFLMSRVISFLILFTVPNNLVLSIFNCLASFMEVK